MKALTLSMLLVLLRSSPAPQAAAARPPETDPRAVVRAAMLARRGDSVEVLRARWTARAAADPGDRAAALGLATLARLTYDYPTADARYRALFAGDSARRDRYDAWARIGLGLAMEAQGLGGQPVLALYMAAVRDARRAGDPTAEGTARLRAGEAFGKTGRGAEGLAQFDSATGVLPNDATDVLAALRCRRAQVFLATAHDGAPDSLRAARAAAASSGDDEAQALCLAATALDYWLRGKQDSVLIFDEQRMAHRRRMRDRSGLSIALASHADHLSARGDYGASARALHEAAAEARASHNHYIEASATLELGSIALVLGDVAGASANVERAVSAFEAVHDTSSLMVARSLRPSVSLAAGDLDGARRELTSILDFWHRQRDWTQLVDIYSRLVAVELRAGDLGAAARALAGADSAGRRANAPSWLADVGYRRGQLAIARGDLAVAEREFARYVATLDTTQHLKRYDGRVRLAELRARRNDAAGAERELIAAGRELDAWRLTLSEPEMRTLAFQASPFQANDLKASIAVVLATLARDGRASAAFELAEGRRARELAERLTRTRALRGLADTAASTQDVVRATAGVAELARALPDDRTALLEYVAGGGGAPTTLFLVTRRTAGAPVAVVLPAADSLVGEVSRIVTLLEAGDDPRSLERTLGSALLDPALAAIDSSVTRLVIVPDGPLHRVPWDALRLPDGRYAAERFSIGVVPSATVMAVLRERPRGGAARSRLLAFGDPAFPSSPAHGSGDDEGETYRSAFAATGGLPRLPSSAREAELVARYADDADVRLGGEATADYLERAPLGGYDVLHFATHALVDDRAATRTALALAPGGADADGFVAASDLAALHLDARLVVLSACRSAGGVVVDGEGVQGLTAPLLAAGARSVVATTWRISDRGTVPFVDAFYAGMARGLPVADALRAAKLDAIRRGAPPRDWAAFTVVGDPFSTVALHEPPRAWHRWALVLGGLLALAGALWLLARTRRAAPGRAAA